MTTRTEQLVALDLAHVWHPFTQMALWPSDAPLIIERAEGNWLIDTEGQRYLDGVSSLWVTVHGHRKPELDEALRAQLGKIAHSTLLGLTNVPAIELAAKLVQIAPKGLEKVFYSDSGSTSVEIALKMAYQYCQLTGRKTKRRFAALTEAYHGDTLGSVSVGGVDLFHDRFRDLLFEVERVPATIEAARALLEKKADTLAGFIVEPLIQGAAGMLTQPRGYLKALETLCREHDVLLICDEVATGFGRTGKMFAVEQEDVHPDFMCVAKGLTGGYLPLAATLTTSRVFRAFLGTAAEQKTFFHGHTYTGNPLACAVALANLELFETQKTLERMEPTVEALTRGLETLAELKHVTEIRQRGLMIGVQLEEYPYGDRKGFAVCQAARKRGVLIRPLGNVVVLMPPLSLTVAEAELLVRAVRESIVEVTEPRSP